MKKFKHKTKNWVATEWDRQWYKVAGLSEMIPVWLIENSGDWQEVIDKDYEILEYSQFWHAQLGKEIISVKRLSDGAIIKVGDRDLHDYEVVSIKERDNKIHVEVCSDIGNMAFPLLKYYEPKPARTPILTSEDGVELFEGEEAFCIYKLSKKCKIKAGTILPSDPVSSYLYFSTCEAAEEYRTWHSYRLCYQDVMDVAGKILPYECAMRFKNLVKSRL